MDRIVVNFNTKEINIKQTEVVDYEPVKETPSLNERVLKIENDINDNIFPYMMDVEMMVLDLSLSTKTSIELNRKRLSGVINMTSYQALERLIKTKKIGLSDVLDRIAKYNDVGKITDEEALSLIDLAHDYLV